MGVVPSGDGISIPSSAAARATAWTVPSRTPGYPAMTRRTAGVDTSATAAILVTSRVRIGQGGVSGCLRIVVCPSIDMVECAWLRIGAKRFIRICRMILRNSDFRTFFV